MKNSNDTSWDRTSDLSICSSLTTVLSRSPPTIKYTNGIDSDPVQSNRRAKYTFLLIHIILFPLVSVFLVTVFHEDLKLCKHLCLIISEMYAQRFVSLIRTLIIYTVTEIEFFNQCTACQLCRIKTARLAKR